ncbi:MAG: hypothetical protein H6642_03965 [Caldilineaceae bacterium]|nr:hypothetical protein [Caldilineaceae bacterium]
MRMRPLLILCFAVLLLAAARGSSQAQSAGPHGSIPAAPVTLENGEFECPAYVDGADERGARIRIPQGWTLTNLAGETPVVYSAREWYAGSCESDAWVERLEGRDALVLRAQDLETPPAPGKPFDAALSQQVTVEPGGAYSVSAWFVSLCGGSFSAPNDCPEGVYMAKLLGLDPQGGMDAAADSVQWVENRANFVGEDGRTRVGWQNLRVAAVAESDSMTVFARVNSPFQWHGNHAFVDAVKIVRAPAAMFAPLPATSDANPLSLAWNSEQSPDVIALGGTYRLYVDIEVRPENGEWRALLTDGGETGAIGFAPRCTNIRYEFRLRARAEQPPAEEAGEGAWPNHRFPGVWSEPVGVYFTAPTGPTTTRTEAGSLLWDIFLPIVASTPDC